MLVRKHLIAGSAIALAFVLISSPAAAQEACVTDTTVAASGGATGPLSFTCGEGSTATGEAAVVVGPLGTGTSSGSVAVGYDANSTAVNGIAIGPVSNAQATNSVAIGMGSYANGVNSIALGPGAANNTYSNSVAIGAWTHNTAANQVHIGGRSLSGVAAGVLSVDSVDAVNGSQLFATNNRISVLEGGFNALETRMDAIELIALDFNLDLERLERKLDGSAAMAIAMSGNAFLPNKAFNVTGNVGTYQGAWAGALQFGALVSPNAAFNAGIAKNFNKRGGVGARAGFTLGWGG